MKIQLSFGSCLAFLISTNFCAAFAPVHLATNLQKNQWNLHSFALNMVVTKEDLLGARDKIDQIIDEKNCGPIFVRLAWHDSGELMR
jgi:hypothetical protein